MKKPWLEHYEAGIPEDINPDTYSSLVELCDENFRKFSPKPAFSNMGVNLSYNQINTLSRYFASYLLNELNLKKGDRIAIMMPNLLQYPVALHGILRAGLVVVNANPLYTSRELEHQLVDSGARAIVIVENFAGVLAPILEKTKVEKVILTQIGDMLGPIKGTLVNFVVKHVKKMVPAFSIPSNKTVKFSKTLAMGALKPFEPFRVASDDIAFLQYTGGTTGVSKGAILTHRNMLANITQALAWLSQHAREGEEIIITALPLYHIFSLTANCLTFQSIGAQNILITNPRDMPDFIKTLSKYPFTAITGVNTLFNGLLNREEFAKLNFSHLKLTLGGGMAVQKAVAERWHAVTGKPLTQAYGLTETSPAVCINPLGLQHFNGSIGLPLSSTLVSIRNDQNEELPNGEDGEVCVKGPQVMRGYWQQPEETAKVFTPDGWLKTGDVGHLNDSGFVTLVDRKKDMILVSGFNVYPNEVEDVAMTHPGLLECAAIAVPDEKSGEAVKLFAVKKDPTLTEAQLINHCRQGLTGYKVPKFVEFRSELPKTNVGKILRRALKS